jgi:hypothetical protein
MTDYVASLRGLASLDSPLDIFPGLVQVNFGEYFVKRVLIET